MHNFAFHLSCFCRHSDHFCSNFDCHRHKPMLFWASPSDHNLMRHPICYVKRAGRNVYVDANSKMNADTLNQTGKTYFTKIRI